MGIYANPAGLTEAEKEARKIGALLACREFSWEPYLKKQDEPPKLIGEWLEKFEQDYFNRRARTAKTETTWTKNYLIVLRRLPQNQELSKELLYSAIAATKPDTKNCKRTCMVLGAFAKLAKLELDTQGLSGS